MEDLLTEEYYVKTYIELEGFTVEEARLTYKERKKLPDSAFCGPDRSYPAHNASHVRAALQRLSQFKSKMKKATWKRIYNCVKRRAKKHGVEISDDVKKKFEGDTEESLLITDKPEWTKQDWIDWVLER